MGLGRFAPSVYYAGDIGSRSAYVRAHIPHTSFSPFSPILLDTLKLEVARAVSCLHVYVLIAYLEVKVALAALYV